MSILEEFIVFVKSIFHWLCYFVVFSLAFFFLGFKQVSIFGHRYLLPLPSDNSFSVAVFGFLRDHLLPSEVHLIVTNPVSAFVSQIMLSLSLGFLITIPLLMYEVIAYICPALLPREKKIVLLSLVPFFVLFLSGCVFSYFLIIPATFKILYPYATTLGALSFFSIDEFIQYVFGLMFSVGMMFLLPLFMILLSFLKIIHSSFWMKKWRFALLFFLILSAIITPDGTGVTMLMLFVPLVGLYFAGCFFAKKVERS